MISITNGVLGDTENEMMLHDLFTSRSRKAEHPKSSRLQFDKIIKSFDSDGDGKLNGQEIESLRPAGGLLSARRPESSANLSSYAFARKRPAPSRDMLEKYDRNKDGKLDAAEFRHSIRKNKMRPNAKKPVFSDGRTSLVGRLVELFAKLGMLRTCDPALHFRIEGAGHLISLCWLVFKRFTLEGAKNARTLAV